jgi:predicted nucleic acid-binding protein
MIKRIVSDTGPLISLEKLDGGYDLIHTLYDHIIVSSIILDEVSYGYTSPKKYLRVHKIDELIQVHPVDTIASITGLDRLHKGEAQAITLALQLNLPLLIEELQGRKIAAEAKIQFSGIGKQILSARKKGYIDDVKVYVMLQEMLYKKRINRAVYDGLIN